MELKTCPICKDDKPLSAYYVRTSRTRRDGRPTYQHGCKACRAQQTAVWQATHPAQTRAINRAATRRYYATHRVAIAARVAARRAADPEAARRAWRARYAAKMSAARGPSVEIV